MVESRYQLAQVNIARMRAPLDSATMAGFVARLDDVNALADGSPGFIWRYQTAEGNATSLRAYDDEMILFNLSVWRSPEELQAYVYRSAHVDVMRRRREWFARFEGWYYALWWVQAGHIPSVAEARSRLEHLRTYGETTVAFSFRQIYPAPDAEDASAPPSPVAGGAWGP